MRKSILIILFISVSIISNAQRKIKKTEVTEEGFSVNMVLEPTIDEVLIDGINYKITPISPEELNPLFIKENSLNGKFNYSHYEKNRKSYFLKKRKKKREKSDFEFLLEGASWLLNNDIINQAEYNELEKRIIFTYDINEAKTRYNTDNIVLSNPYYINFRYLSVFKIEISNTTNKTILFDKDIVITTGGNVYTPLSSNFIIRELTRCNLMNTEKAFSLERNNMLNEFYIPAQSKIIKYFSIMPINYNNDKITISFSDLGKLFEWKITKDEKTIDETYTFYEFQTYWDYSGMTSQMGEEFSLIKSDSPFVYLNNDDIFIEENNLANGFEIFTLSLYNDAIYYGRTSNIKGHSFIKSDKNKRENIYLKMTKAKELKKKVKQ